MWRLNDKLVYWHVLFYFIFFLCKISPTKGQRSKESTTAQALAASKTVLPKLKTQNTNPLTTLNSFPKCLTHTCWAANISLSCIVDGSRSGPRRRWCPWWVSQTPSTLSIHDLKKTCQSGFCKSESLELICLSHEFN